MLAQQQTVSDFLVSDGQAELIVETDESFLPVMTPDESSPDQHPHWLEAKLSLANVKGCTEMKFGASFQRDPAAAGHQLRTCAIQARLGRRTQVHGIGDDAAWIIHQMEEQFAAQGTYLVDFYHTCGYLAAAAPACADTSPEDWLKQQKQRLKQAEVSKVLRALKVHREPASVSDAEAPVRVAYRYLSHRVEHLDYQWALEKGLPIGSGEIESAHRYVMSFRNSGTHEIAQCLLMLNQC